jgi:hypothetical protein
MPHPLDPATLPRNVTALRSLLLQREADHAAVLEQQSAELQAARNGLKEQVLRNEQLKPNFRTGFQNTALKQGNRGLAAI